MADDVDPIEAALEELDAEETKPPSSTIRRLLPIMLAVATLGGFGGVVWYAYSTGIREGSEFAAPILKPDGPSKVAPKSLGGQQIADQDKLVYGKIDKSSEPRRVERLLPPPENPLPAPVAKKPAPPPLPAPKLNVPKVPPTSELPAPPRSVPAPSAEKTAEPTKDENSAAEAKLAKPSKTIKDRSTPPKFSLPAAPVAKHKPAAAPSPKVASKAPIPAPKTPVAAPKPDPSKGYRIQIGSLRSAAAAKTAWEKWVKQHGAILGGFSLLVKRVELDKKGVYYRVQAGPLKDKAAAKRVCDALKQKKVGCFVVRP